MRNGPRVPGRPRSGVDNINTLRVCEFDILCYRNKRTVCECRVQVFYISKRCWQQHNTRINTLCIIGTVQENIRTQQQLFGLSLPLHEVFHASASEFLSLLPVLVHWAQTILAQVDELRPVVRSFLLLGHVLDLLQMAARPWAVEPETLSEAMSAWHQAFIDAFGEDDLPPKAHYIWHLARWLRKSGFLLNTLVLERKHKTIKMHGEQMDSASDAFDRHVLEEVTAHGLHQLATSDTLTLPLGLMQPTKPSKTQLAFFRETWPEATSFKVANVCRFARRGVCCVGDVVTWGAEAAASAGRVWFLAEIDADLVVCGVYVWSLVQRFTSYSTWRGNGRWGLLEAKQIQEVCIWSGDDQAYTVINHLTMGD